MRTGPGGPWECPADADNACTATGWTLAIPIYVYWVGTGWVLPLPGIPTHRTNLARTSAPPASTKGTPVDGPLGHAHMTGLDPSKEILGV